MPATGARRPIIAGNWKMYKGPAEVQAFISDLRPAAQSYSNVDIAVAPTFLALPAAAQAAAGSAIKLAAQNAHWQANGAYTSQVSAAMLRDFVQYIIIGHSECRAYLHETDAMIQKKARAILDAGLQAIIAVGESLAQNEASETVAFVRGQVQTALQGLSAAEMGRVLIAYEPIWAIGTGKSASGRQADRIIGEAVRATVGELYGAAVADGLRILYGGSVKPANIEEFMAQPNIDGALVGGASLQVADFSELIAKTASLYARG